MSKDSFKSSVSFTKAKVAVGFSLLIIFFLLAILFVYKDFRSIVDSVNVLGNDDDKSENLNNIAEGISDIRNKAFIYSNTLDDKDFLNYVESCQNTQLLIDSLKVVNSDYKSLDSIRIFYNNYLETISKWLVLEGGKSNNELAKISKIVKSREDSLVRSNVRPPVTKTKVTTEVIEKESSNSEKIDDSKNTNFIKKIFTKKKKTSPATPSVQKIDRTIKTTIDTKQDTIYYQQVESFLDQMKETIDLEEKSNVKFENELTKTELRLLETQALLINKINTLLDYFSKMNEESKKQEIYKAKMTANTSSSNLLLILIVCLIVAFIFGYVVFSDLTKSNFYKLELEKEKLQTEKLAKAKEEFLAQMSHEIRAPLTNIIGISEQILVQDKGISNKEKATLINAASNHLKSIVNDILDISKIESGTISFEKIGFSADYVFREVIDILKFSAQEKKISLSLKYEEANLQKLQLLGDPIRLKQVLINLISNAIKFTEEEGRVELSISAIFHKKYYKLICKVSDSGIGIDSERLESIFEDYVQENESINRKFGGTGLGLSITKKIIESQNGTIYVESELGKGSVFTVKIPFGISETIEYPKMTDSSYPLVDFSKKRILVVDDDKIIETFLKPTFESWDMDVVFIHDSQSVMEIVFKEKFDLMMIDLQMPNLNGYDLIQMIEGDSSHLNFKTPIVICSGNLNIRNTEKYFVLTKPFSKNELKQMLSELFQKSQVDYSMDNFITFADGDTETLKLFVDTFIREARNDLHSLVQFQEEKDFKNISEIAHKLKNTYGQLNVTDALSNLFFLENVVNHSNISEEEIAINISRLLNVSERLFQDLQLKFEL